MAGRRSPQAEPRISLTVTLLAFSNAMVAACSCRYSSREGETASRSSFLRMATSFLLRSKKRNNYWLRPLGFKHVPWLVYSTQKISCSWCNSYYYEEAAAPVAIVTFCCHLPVYISVSFLQNFDDLWQQMSWISGTEQIQQNLLSIFVIDDLVQRRQNLLHRNQDQVRPVEQKTGLNNSTSTEQFLDHNW